MDVTYSNDITNIVKNLRENIYFKNEFKDLFTTNLQKDINAIDVKFNPDKFGGWIVNVSISPESFTSNSSFYISKIVNSLTNTITTMKYNISIEKMACNLINVIIVGKNDIIIKL